MAIKLESVILIGVLYYTLILALGKLDFKLNTLILLIEPADDKNNKMTCAPSEDSDQP